MLEAQNANCKSTRYSTNAHSITLSRYETKAAEEQKQQRTKSSKAKNMIGNSSPARSDYRMKRQLTCTMAMR